MGMKRRDFLKTGAAAFAGAVAVTTTGCHFGEAWREAHGSMRADATPWFSISLAQWSLHRELFKGELNHLDFAATAREFGIDGIEYVNQFFMEKVRNASYLAEMNQRAADADVQQLLIMVDGEGRLGDPDLVTRKQVVDRHRKWLEAAATLGCHSIRVNAASEGTRDEQMRLAADGLTHLCDEAAAYGLNVLVENHGGYSSDGSWLAGVMRLSGHRLLGTLPDFGNFYMGELGWYDIYQGTDELMPFAQAVSAKTHHFDDDGRESDKDYWRLLRSVRDAGYRGWVGIEWEGDQLPEREGITKTRDLLVRVRGELAREAGPFG
jgi:sugar phosphate isomerase/epimerase